MDNHVISIVIGFYTEIRSEPCSAIIRVFSCSGWELPQRPTAEQYVEREGDFETLSSVVCLHQTLPLRVDTNMSLYFYLSLHYNMHSIFIWKRKCLEKWAMHPVNFKLHTQNKELRFDLLLCIVVLNSCPGCLQGWGDSHMWQVTLCNLNPPNPQVISHWCL